MEQKYQTRENSFAFLECRLQAGIEYRVAPPRLDLVPGFGLVVSPAEAANMVESVGYAALDEMIDDVVPDRIRDRTALNLPAAKTETEAVQFIQLEIEFTP